MLTAHQFDKYRKKLHVLRADLDACAPSLRDEACHGAGGENAGDLSNQEAEAVVNLGLAANEATRRQEVDDALLRLDEGTFGVCEECGSEIDRERLEAIPYARLCIRCAERS